MLPRCPSGGAPLSLAQERLDLRLDALHHVLDGILGLPPQRARAARLDPAVRAPDVRELEAREELEQLLVRERRRGRVGRDAELDERLPDRGGELRPGVLAVLAVVVAVPAVAGGVWVLADRVEERDEEVGRCVEIGQLLQTQTRRKAVGSSERKRRTHCRRRGSRARSPCPRRPCPPACARAQPG